MSEEFVLFVKFINYDQNLKGQDSKNELEDPTDVRSAKKIIQKNIKRNEEINNAQKLDNGITFRYNRIRIHLTVKHFMKKLFALVALLLLISIKGYAYETPLEYMKGNNLTESQANYVLEKSKETRDPDHYIKWFTAIQAHEQGTTFINGTTKYIAGRLKP